ncbi:hypothetical protein ACIBG8_48225 [Nonomuraea sp. NPDC050556]|uniref:hypothetical protein n=1 Tax=Nonomuraea sp. NPDC050556 TaxID=3364369 RepID=UPI0037A54DC0
MTTLERRYRWLLRAYPTGYRSDYGDELLDVLLDTAEPGRAVPSLRETLALLAGGLRTRITQAAQGPAWADGIHLAVTALSLFNLAVLIPYASTIPLWLGLSAAGFVLILLGRVRPALPVVALTGVKVAAVALAQPWLDRTLLPVFPDDLWSSGPALYGSGGPIAPITSYLLVLLGLLALAMRREPPRRRSWWWILAVPLVAGADPAWLDIVGGTPSAVMRVGLESALLCAAAYAGHLTADLRWAIAAGIYLLPASAVLAENIEMISRQDLAHAGLVIVLTMAAAAVPLRAGKRVLL